MQQGKKDDLREHYEKMAAEFTIPQNHVDYLWRLKHSGFEPRVIYDIGSCVLGWYREAKKIWPTAEIICFEAFEPVKFLYEQQRVRHSIGVLSDTDHKELKFYINERQITGNSYYKENQDHIYPEDSFQTRIGMTLDTVVAQNGYPMPDLIKIDVQGAELDILNGGRNTIRHAERMIVELQSVDYNRGAPKVGHSLPYIESLGFQCIDPLFQNNGADGDYGFVRI